MWVYRRLLKISWEEKISNDSVLKRLNLKPYVMKAIRNRTLVFFGHMIRRNDLKRVLLEGRIEGKRPRGKPRQVWTDNILKWSNSKSYSDLRGIALNRKAWKMLIIAANHHIDDGT